MALLLGTAPNQVPTNGDLGTMAFQDQKAVNITGGLISGAPVTTPYLSVTSITNITPSLTFNGSNTNIAAGSAVSGTYLQSIFQNTSATATASVNYVLSNDLGTDSTYYGEFGMNSSVYSGASTPSDFFSINNGIYFSGHDGDVTIGSGNGKKTYLAWGTTGQSAHVINATGAIGLNTNLTAGTGSGTTNFGVANQFLVSAGSGATPTWAYIVPQQATTAAAPAYVKGAMYFDTTLNKLRIGGATAWETVTSV